MSKSYSAKSSLKFTCGACGEEHPWGKYAEHQAICAKIREQRERQRRDDRPFIVGLILILLSAGAFWGLIFWLIWRAK